MAATNFLDMPQLFELSCGAVAEHLRRACSQDLIRSRFGIAQDMSTAELARTFSEDLFTDDSSPVELSCSVSAVIGWPSGRACCSWTGTFPKVKCAPRVALGLAPRLMLRRVVRTALTTGKYQGERGPGRPWARASRLLPRGHSARLEAALRARLAHTRPEAAVADKV